MGVRVDAADQLRQIWRRGGKTYIHIRLLYGVPRGFMIEAAYLMLARKRGATRFSAERRPTQSPSRFGWRSAGYVFSLSNR